MNIRPVSAFTIVLSLAVTLFASQAFAAAPSYTKISGPLRTITRAVATGHQDAVMQAALTRQLFHESGPLAARWNASGQVQIYAYYGRFGAGPDVPALQALGATEIQVSNALYLVQAWVPANKLAEIASLPWVQRLTVPQYALTNSAQTSAGAPRAGATPPSVDQFLGAAAFRQATGDNGSGIDVGVINAGDTGLSQSQADGDLPSGVWVDPNLPGTNDGEGTAMLEIVHTLAPAASLSFCGPQTTVDFLTCLSDLQQHGAQIIVDDLAFPDTAYFTNDSDVTAVQQWQSQNPTIRLVTAAGNFATSFWSGNYTPASINPVTINNVTYSQAQNFGTNANPNYYETITVAPAAQVEYILEWADPWVPTANITASTPDDPNDYDAVLYDANFNVIACNQGMTSDSNGCSQAGAATSNTPGVEPGIFNEWTNTSTSSVTVNLAIFLRAGTPSPQLKLFVASPNSCEVTISPVTPADSIVDHATLPYPAEITVGAVNASAALNNQFVIEPYSSQGPVNLPLLTNTPIQKPDFVGVDGVSVSGAGGFPPAECGEPAPNPPVYYGTSAAAPDVAALIALLESGGYTSGQVYGVLQSNTLVPQGNQAIPSGAFGYGLPDIATVKAPNQQIPVANRGTATTQAGAAVTGTLSASGTGTLTFAVVTQPAHGSVTLNGSTFTYTPATGYSGSDSFTFTVSNSAGASSPSTESITVSAPPPPGKSGGGGLGTLGLACLAFGAYSKKRLCTSGGTR